MIFEEFREVGKALKSLRLKLMRYDFPASKATTRKHPASRALRHLDRLQESIDGRGAERGVMN